MLISTNKQAVGLKWEQLSINNKKPLITNKQCLANINKLSNNALIKALRGILQVVGLKWEQSERSSINIYKSITIS